MAELEIHGEILPGPQGVQAKLRKAARDAYLSARALAFRDPGGNFIRFLAAHFVFDDQIEKFDRQIKALKRIGRFVDADTAFALATGERELDGRYFHLSFDDGLRCLLRNAAPILVREEVPATVFVNPHFLNHTDAETHSRWVRTMCHLRPAGLMSWDELREIRTAGFEIGAHTRNHTRLVDIADAPEQLESEIAGCKRDIEAAIGASCDYFAWPYGSLADISPPAVDTIREAGYRAAFGSFRAPIQPGVTNRFMLPRQHIEPHLPLSHVTFFARGGYEPLAVPDW